MAATVLWVACARTGAEAPGPEAPPDDIVRRHWDQACSSREHEPVFAELAELFDTARLGRDLAAVEPRPRRLAPPWPVVEFITRYAADGRPVRTGLWEAEVEPDVAGRVEEVLRARVRRLPRLLRPTGFRTRVTFGARTRVGTVGPVVCVPHLVHEPGRRASGLPDTVATWGGQARIREGDDSTAVVRIVVDTAGRVIRVDPRQGTERAVEHARRVVSALRFEPALRNGEPVDGELVQTFRFRRREAAARAPGRAPDRQEEP